MFPSSLDDHCLPADSIACGKKIQARHQAEAFGRKESRKAAQGC